MTQNRSKHYMARALLAAGLMIAGDSAMSLEQPDYTVVFRDGDVEYRQYEPYLVSETVIENVSSYQAAGNEGFRRLFRYITGGNVGRAKIAMTAPVAQTLASEKIEMTVPVQQGRSTDGWRVAFMLPTQYTMETAPAPTDPRVQVREVPGRLMAVLRYSGRWTEKNYVKRKDQLRSAIVSESVMPLGDMQSALYNAPFTPPFLRRNEVMVEVDRLPAKAQAVAAGADNAARALAY
ncbi:MAG: SOUL family heme-binding protein [Gammaproteobacteria bacterium]